MGDVGDYWKEAREAKRHYRLHGMWPGQKKCETCGKPFTPREDWHTRCFRCEKARKK